MNKVWTYILSKPLSENELSDLKKDGLQFISDWTAHENKLSGSVEIFKNKILIVKVDETVNAASGCSIDKLTRFIKEIEKKYSIELLNRFLVAYKNGDGIEVIHATKIKELIQNKNISTETIIYNSAVSNEIEFNSWEQPLHETWLNKYLV